MVAVISATVFSYAVTTQHALDRGVFNFDSLWYHLPFAADMVQMHSVVGMHHVETVFTNWFYPQNSELLHSVGILLTGRDTLSLFLNLRLVGCCVPSCLLRGAALRARGKYGDCCGDLARVPHAGRQGPGSGKERSDGGGADLGLDRDLGRGVDPGSPFRGSFVRTGRTKEPRDGAAGPLRRRGLRLGWRLGRGLPGWRWQGR